MGCNGMYVEDFKNTQDLVDKLLVSAFQNFFRIENLLNIKEIMSKNMFVIF